MSAKVIFDSSVWIAIHRGSKKTTDIAVPLIEKNLVVTVDLIVAEVAGGARSKSDYERLISGFLLFDMLKADWIDVAKLAFKIGRSGSSPPLTDIYIAQCSIESGLPLLTHDRHFEQISKLTPLNCQIIKE
jgi:predicted nucleic acid-binding protein